jgi:hypothetical protein
VRPEIDTRVLARVVKNSFRKVTLPQAASTLNVQSIFDGRPIGRSPVSPVDVDWACANPFRHANINIHANLEGRINKRTPSTGA